MRPLKGVFHDHSCRHPYLAAPTWDLESIFPGGSASPQFKSFRDKVKAELADAAIQLKTLPPNLEPASREGWKSFIVLLQDLHEHLELIRSFGGCLIAQNVADNQAQSIVGEADQLISEWEKLKTSARSLVDQSIRCRLE